MHMLQQIWGHVVQSHFDVLLVCNTRIHEKTSGSLLQKHFQYHVAIAKLVYTEAIKTKEQKSIRRSNK